VSIISDMKRFKDIGTQIENIDITDIDSPESLETAIQEAKDIAENYLFEMKAIPGRLQRWADVLKDIGIYTAATDVEDLAQETLLGEIKTEATSDMEDAQTYLTEALEETESLRASTATQYDIGGVAIDYLYNPNPVESTDTISQSIVSSENVDRANEDAEHNNTTLTATVVLSGDDRTTRLNQIRTMRKNKELITVVFNETYDKMLIKNISPKFDGSDSIEVDITFENLFVQTLQRTAEPMSYFEQPTKSTTTAGQQGTRYYTGR